MHRGAIYILKEPKIDVFALGKESAASILFVFNSTFRSFVFHVFLVPEPDGGVVFRAQGHSINSVDRRCARLPACARGQCLIRFPGRDQRTNSSVKKFNDILKRCKARGQFEVL